MPVSMSATTTEWLPVVVAQAWGAWILVRAYCWLRSGSLGVSCPSKTSFGPADADSSVRGSSSSTRGRVWWKRASRRGLDWRARCGEKRRMGKLLDANADELGDCSGSGVRGARGHRAVTASLPGALPGG